MELQVDGDEGVMSAQLSKKLVNVLREQCDQIKVPKCL